MKTRIVCPFHYEETPSLVRNRDSWYCYGSCRKSYTHEEVENKLGNPVEFEVESEEYKEDLSEKFKYIETLSKTKVRGFELPSDDRGYYLCWPNAVFYKYRVYDPGRGPKYIGPKGHKPPLFWARQRGQRSLCISEGELNSLSLAEAFPDFDVCSPGSATMFNSTNLQKYLHIFKEYSKVIVVLDNDAAGFKGLIESKAFFLYKLPFIDFILMSPDANEILVEEGKEALREKLSRQDRR